MSNDAGYQEARNDEKEVHAKKAGKIQSRELCMVEQNQKNREAAQCLNVRSQL